MANKGDFNENESQIKRRRRLPLELQCEMEQYQKQQQQNIDALTEEKKWNNVTTPRTSIHRLLFQICRWRNCAFYLVLDFPLAFVTLIFELLNFNGR
uniref:Uncharacterized protein n=1 Tax=Globodera rostochiensis TaxID=31243 RepID=A0A914H7H9_GLORO